MGRMIKMKIFILLSLIITLVALFLVGYVFIAESKNRKLEEDETFTDKEIDDLIDRNSRKNL